MYFWPPAVIGVSEEVFEEYSEFWKDLPSGKMWHVDHRDNRIFDLFKSYRSCVGGDSQSLEDIKYFEAYLSKRNISFNEGITHPHEWIRKFTAELGRSRRIAGANISAEQDPVK